MTGDALPAGWAARVLEAEARPQLFPRVTVPVPLESGYRDLAAGGVYRDLADEIVAELSRQFWDRLWAELHFGAGVPSRLAAQDGPCPCGGSGWVCEDHPRLPWGGMCCAGPGTAELYRGPLRVTWRPAARCQHGACHCGGMGEPCGSRDSGGQGATWWERAADMPVQVACIDADLRKAREIRELRWLTDNVRTSPGGAVTALW